MNTTPTIRVVDWNLLPQEYKKTSHCYAEVEYPNRINANQFEHPDRVKIRKFIEADRSNSIPGVEATWFDDEQNAA